MVLATIARRGSSFIELDTPIPATQNPKAPPELES